MSESSVAELWAARPRSRFLRVSAGLIAGVVAWSWLTQVSLGAVGTARGWENLRRFLTEVTPYPLLRGEPLWPWVTEVLGGGLEALGVTLALSVAAIVMAGAVGAVASPLAARTVMTASPWLSGSAGGGWGLARGAVRGVLIVIRAIPEYLWAFLLIALMGVGPWAAVLALALHNAGILGRLGSEVMDDLPAGVPSGLRGLGGSRGQVVMVGVWPTVLNRFLLYFFYRWETCVREATVLGLLGVASLGFHIQQARAAMRYDEMLLWVLMASGLILVGDLVSVVARGAIRRA